MVPQATFDVEDGGQHAGQVARTRRKKYAIRCAAALATCAGAMLGLLALGLVQVPQRGGQPAGKFTHWVPAPQQGRAPTHLHADSRPRHRLVPEHVAPHPPVMLTSAQRDRISRRIGIKQTAYSVGPTAMRMSAEDGGAKAGQDGAQAVAAAGAAEVRTAAEIDETIYNLNNAIVDTAYELINQLYPLTGGERDYVRFYVLETIARVPYFAYMSVLHLRETFGDRRPGSPERQRAHYAQADNKMHHLVTMESLGGNSSVVDRSFAQAMSFFYYWYVVGLYAYSEQAAYHLGEVIANDAYNKYDGFLKTYEEKLKGMPVPDIAREYYDSDNNVMFDLLCAVPEKSKDDGCGERPPLSSLYDVFVNIRNDEREHWKALCNLVQYEVLDGSDAKVESTKMAPAPPAVA